jgi:hypothetical protein
MPSDGPAPSGETSVMSAADARPSPDVAIDVDLIHLPHEVRGTSVETNRLRVVDVAGKGRGVLARVPLAAGEIIERVAVIPVAPEQVPHLDRTTLEHYVYDWQGGGVAVALGCGSLYNHSYAPNAMYRKNFAARVIEYVALVDIAADDEILINYNGDPKDQSPLWFHVVEGS